MAADWPSHRMGSHYDDKVIRLAILKIKIWAKLVSFVEKMSTKVVDPGGMCRPSKF